MKKIILVFCIVLIAFVVFRIWTGMGRIVRQAKADEPYARLVVNSVGGATNVIIAGRQMIQTFAHHGSEYVEVNVNDVNVPAVIRRMNPRSLQVCSDNLCIILNGEGRRSYLLVYSENAIQIGTTQITDCLWFWNGRPSEETKNAYRNALETRKTSIFNEWERTGTE